MASLSLWPQGQAGKAHNAPLAQVPTRKPNLQKHTSVITWCTDTDFMPATIDSRAMVAHDIWPVLLGMAHPDLCLRADCPS